jgi:hypothetical protein
VHAADEYAREVPALAERPRRAGEDRRRRAGVAEPPQGLLHALERVDAARELALDELALELLELDEHAPQLALGRGGEGVAERAERRLQAVARRVQLAYATVHRPRLLPPAAESTAVRRARRPAGCSRCGGRGCRGRSRP